MGSKRCKLRAGVQGQIKFEEVWMTLDLTISLLIQLWVCFPSSNQPVCLHTNKSTSSQRRAWNKVNLVRKYTLSQTPNYLSNSFARQNSNHSYSTRNNDFLILPKVRTNYGKRTFLFSGAGLFNSLPPKIRNVDNKDFARLTREFFKIRMNFY